MFYVAMAGEFGARTVLDIGCGTGTLACLLGQAGQVVTAIDPAAASLAVARRKPLHRTGSGNGTRRSSVYLR
jgi:2-polyprenyl-3-methyl-5-hydroxy-6-metoxy-1,4-benzoquinol methylase